MDLFSRRKSHTDVQQFLLRLANNRQATACTLTREQRCTSRTTTNLNIGVWVVPVEDDAADVDAAFAALTSDIGHNGLGVLADRPSTTEEIMVVFPSDLVPTFLRVTVQACTSLGAGFYRLGTEATELVTLDDFPELERVGLVHVTS